MARFRTGVVSLVAPIVALVACGTPSNQSGSDAAVADVASDRSVLADHAMSDSTRVDATASSDVAADATQSSSDSARGDAVNDMPPVDTNPNAQGVFVVVGYGGRRMRSIDDGITWTDDQSLEAHGGDDPMLLRAITAGNGEFVALGYHVMTSPDGRTWNDAVQDLGQWIGAIVFANGMFVSIGGYGWRATSADATHWTHHDIDTAASHSHNGLAYGAGHFVATNDSGNRSFSADGSAWTYSSGATGTTTSMVAFGNDAFIAVGDRNVVRSVDDGATWSSSATLSAAATGLVFANGHFTATARGHVFTSNDGVTWIDHTSSTSVDGYLICGHGTYVLVAGTSLYRSTDEVTWTRTFQDSGNAFECGAFGP